MVRVEDRGSRILCDVCTPLSYYTVQHPEYSTLHQKCPNEHQPHLGNLYEGLSTLYLNTRNISHEQSP
jgi:hypothetical protein